MQAYPIITVDGRRLYYMFVAGARKVIANQARLNRINVFPVNDGDTGANMTATLRAVVESVTPERSYKRTLDVIAESALMNARGNSGIIFAQFIYGVNVETTEVASVTIAQFAQSIKQSVSYIYKAVAQPVEGTMLTMVRAWADFIYANRSAVTDFNQLFLNSKATLERTLAETTSKLDILAKSNVVDAGANAFAYFIEGIIDCIRHKNIRHLIKSHAEAPRMPEGEHAAAEKRHVPREITHRYCTEAMIRNVDLDQNQLSAMLQNHGDSVVVAGASTASRLHVHTTRPDRLFDTLQNHATITFQKADDMLRQSQTIYHRKWNIALVTDSACDLATDLIDNYQVHLLPINIFFGPNHYLDKVTMRPRNFYRRLNDAGDHPTTAQINEIAFKNLYTHLAAHYDAVIAVHLTAKFSGTCFNSRKAAETVSAATGTPITVIDSKTVSGALGLIVLRIARAIEKGDPYDAIVNQAAKWVRHTHILVSVKTLKYMVRGGRVSPLKGVIARLLNLNPIVSMDPNGNSMLLGKTYGQQANMHKVMRHVKQINDNQTIWNYIVLHANNRSAADWYVRRMAALCQKEPACVVNISPVIGAS
ncbi:MAG: DegV family protein, partial [Desulfosarcina sp.]